MHISSTVGEQSASVFWDLSGMDPVEAARIQDADFSGDVVDISALAREKLEQAGQKSLVRQALSLPRIKARIEAVRAEIETVWNSALPKKEKYNLIAAKENEIALLQAGQFAFAKAGFSMEA